ncbi:hypothetical protein MOO44_03485 [Nicoliella spurrieriana]|uniref:Uncharacterized protein n=1 Tax=Nicoliella spurrieriana TaxID=2925830 RepID=A0A976RT59_9LACO|nr:hypothetical protein [Nicoliella spurrieriana]UQS87234.1 hypothetical protein MOO44_03485 [Nicoliella spurrieriana]
MINIKQHIRMYAETAVENHDLVSTEDVRSIAQPDHKSWNVAVNNFQNNNRTVQITLSPVDNSSEYRVLDSNDNPIWQGQFTEANFNSIIQNVLMKLNII